jgi:eukaryotic-like serine/threonine-protein kinase
MAECQKCHAENRDDSKFCGNCAAPLGQAGATLTRTLETPVQVIRAGTMIAGKYKLVEELGHGGMGVVYKAEDLKLKRFVALKFLPPHLMDSPDLKERFLVEAQAAAALNHPNICTIYEVGEDEARPFIAMEFVDGETLRDRLRQGSLKASDALAIAGQVAAGLGEAHRNGIIHRDVKSANIMITAKGQSKVMDFGLAKLRGGSSLTKSQTTIGTVAYMSPEQARGGELDQRTDIWSLGVVLYEMLGGKLPFLGDHDQAVIHQIVHVEPEPLKKLTPNLPSGLEEILGQALAKKPAARYQTMEDLGTDLEAIGEGLRPLRARPRRISRKILGIRAAYVFAAPLVILAMLFGLNVGGMRNRVLGKAAAAPAAIRLAVLPFENLSGDPEQEYFSDGMTQEMIAQLGRLHPETLSVIARSSVMR